MGKDPNWFDPRKQLPPVSDHLACEQALLFGQAKQAPRGFAARSRVLARLVSLAQIGELAGRLAITLTYYKKGRAAEEHEP